MNTEARAEETGQGSHGTAALNRPLNRGGSVHWLIGAALTLTVFAVFFSVLGFDFVRFDDPEYILENDIVRKGLTAEGFQWMWRANLGGNWHPLTCLSHMLDCQLFGIQSGKHHFVSLLWHAVNSVLLFLLFRRMTAALWRSALLGALFALHPLHVESVAWISERKDVLSTFFFLLSLWFYVAYVQRKASAVGHLGTKAKAGYGGALLCFALGLLAKPMVVTLPCVLFLLDMWPLNRVRLFVDPTATKVPLRSLVLEKIPFFVLAVVLSAITFSAQRTAMAGEQMPISWRLGNAVVAYTRYIQKTFWPSELTFLYPHPGQWPAGIVLTSAILLLLLTVIVVWIGRSRAYLPVGWFWFLGTLVPVIGLVQVGLQSMADRYTYIPLIGIFVMLVWGAAEIMDGLRLPRPIFAAAGLATVAVCIGITKHQLTFWKDSVALYHRALEVTSRDPVYRVAFQNPIYVNFHVRLCDDLVQGGEPQRAEVYLREVAAIAPINPDVHLTLGNALVVQNKWDDAGQEFNEVTKLDPKDARPHVYLGRIAALQNRMDDAQTEFEKALELQPNDADTHFTLGLLFEQIGRRKQAVAHYREALQNRPGFTEAEQRLRQLDGR